MNKLILSLLLLSGYTNAASKNLGVGLLLAPIAEKIDEETKKPSFLEKMLFWRKPASEPARSGVRINFAFMERKIEGPFWIRPNDSFTTRQLLNELDVLICQKIVEKQRKSGIDLHNLSDEDFTKLNLLKKQYVDAVPAVLEKVYGKSAQRYITEIEIARKKFEAEHNGLLLGLR